MSQAAEDVARAFGPFLAVEEYETITSLNRKTRPPVFLRRNLSYSASRTDRRQRRANAIATLRVQLESVVMPAQYSTAITVVAALCAVVPGPDGRDALVPLSARLGRVPVAAQPGQPPPPPCILTLPVPLPGGALPKDTVLLVLHKRDRSLSRLVRCMLRARHRGDSWLDGGKALTCGVADDCAMQWFASGTRVLYCGVPPSEEMGVSAVERRRNGDAAPSQQGLLELQPGVVDVHEPFFIDDDDSGGDGEEESEAEAALSEVPGSFSVRPAPVRDATPMLRYCITLDDPDYGDDAEGEEIRAAKRRRRSSFTFAAGGSPSSDVLAAAAEGAATPAAPLTVHLCAADGNLRSTIRLTQGFACPFESCGQRCRPGVAPLLQHLTACHPYYEFYTTATPGEGPQVWVRVKKHWFDTDGSFLPSVTALTVPLANHPLAPLLWRAATWLPFEYRCSGAARRLRLGAGGKGPVDVREEEMEASAAAALEGKATAWETAELLTPGVVVMTPEEETEAEPRRESGRRRGRGAGGGGQRGGPRTRGGRRRAGNAGYNIPSPSSIKLSLTTRAGLPKFYHSRGCVPMTAGELEDPFDSDDDSDTELYMLHCRTALEEREGLCPEEREFMLAWNRYTHENPILADFEVGRTCVAFAQEHAEAMADPEGPFRRCFAAHVVNLWKFRLLTPSQMHAALTAVPQQQAGVVPSM